MLTRHKPPAVKIETGVPLPRDGRGDRLGIPWADLKIGDSFVYPGERARSAAYSASKTHGHKYATRKLPDGTIRIWRVE